MKLISDYITSHFSYDPSTGLITNTKTSKTYTNIAIGGYISDIAMRNKITQKGSAIKVHRLAWFLYYGSEPTGVIDHIDGDGTNNKITNLRITTNQGNMQNKKRYKNSSQYMVGVLSDYRNKVQTYQAQGMSIKTGKKVFFGTFYTEIDAHFVSVYYKQVHYALYNGNDLTYINGLPHPYFTGTLPSIVATIVDTKGKSALNYMSK